MKTTQKQLNEFKSYCLWAIDLFNLGDWNIHFLIDKLEDADAEIEQNSNVRHAVIRLADKLSNGVDLELVAYHEIGHLLVSEHYAMASTFFSEDIIRPVDEAIANRIGHALKKIRKQLDK